MADVRSVLRSCDPALLDPRGDAESPDCCEAAGLVFYLMDRRRVQKVLWRQLFVLDSMMSLLEDLKSAQQLMTQPCQPLPEGGARSRWKALKVESRLGVEQTEALLRSVQDRVQQIHSKRHKVTQLIQDLHNKKQQCEQLSESVQKAQSALQSCDRQLTQLRAESEAMLGQLIAWQHLQDELQAQVSTLQDVMQIHLLSFNQSDLCLELRSRTPSSEQASRELEPLKLCVTWSHNDRFKLQLNDGGLADDCVYGRRCELSAVLLEVMQRYLGQFELLSEIQGLRSSFAIDWRPAQRLLVYLKSTALVCHLEVEEGYPNAGQAQLLSVQRDGRPVDTSVLKPPQTGPSLTDWLVFLYSCPLL